jgi:hypothetical protein
VGKIININHSRRKTKLACCVCGGPRQNQHSPFCDDCKENRDSGGVDPTPAQLEAAKRAMDEKKRKQKNPAEAPKKRNYYRYLHQMAMEYAGCTLPGGDWTDQDDGGDEDA